MESDIGYYAQETQDGGYVLAGETDSGINAWIVKVGPENRIVEDSKIIIPVANFSSNVTKGYSPLVVQFYDFSQNSISRVWDFNNDGQTDSTYINPIYVYRTSGIYIVNLTVTNENGISSKLISISVWEEENKNQWLPTANFSNNVTSGFAPFSVQFNDSSENVAGWYWDFGDGATSTDQNPMHIYYAEGTYNINLIVSNANGTSPQTARATVTVQSSSHDDSNDGNSHSSGGGGGGGSGGGGGGGGGGSGSPEPQSNVGVKEISQTFITSGSTVKFNFPRNATPVVYISLDSKKTVGKTSTIVEMLKEKSILVSGLPTGEVYKYLNIWVGNGGFGNSDNIANAVINFKVEKSWIQDKKIEQSSIALNRYRDKKWNQLSTNLSGEDNKYLYFIAQTPGFSPFAITGKNAATVSAVQSVTVNGTQSAMGNTRNNVGNTTAKIDQTPESTQNSNSSRKESTKSPDFEIASGIVCLLSVFLYKRR